MCDTFVKSCGGEGASFFGKNSDRHPEELQMLLWGGGELEPFLSYLEQLDPRPAEYEAGPLAALRRVHSRYDHPYRALVSRPVWMWGAEMGLNEKGVAIGNEALFSRGGRKREGLLGMDILRLALHNAADAQEALELITGLIEGEGQGGNGAYKGRLYYDNSFMIRDARRAFILESAGGRWAARPVATAAISNTYRLTDDFTQCDTATGQQIYRPGSASAEGERRHYSFARRHERLLHRFLTRGEQRRSRSEYLMDRDGFDLRAAFALLRDHGGSPTPNRGMGNLCMHPGRLLKNVTAASMVVSYTRGEATAWVTAAPHPCVALFQPWRCSVADTQGPVFEEYAAGAEYAEAMRRHAAALVSAYPRWKRELRPLREEIEGRSVLLLEGSSSGSAVYSPDGEDEEQRVSETTARKAIEESRRRAVEYWDRAVGFIG